jgi:hypothetical protein
LGWFEFGDPKLPSRSYSFTFVLSLAAADKQQKLIGGCVGSGYYVMIFFARGIGRIRLSGAYQVTYVLRGGGINSRAIFFAGYQYTAHCTGKQPFYLFCHVAC